MYAALLVERRDRLGAQDLSARGVDELQRDLRIHFAEDRSDQLAALVHLGDNFVRFEAAEGADDSARPGDGREALHGEVGENVRVTVFAATGDDDAAGIGVFAARDG